MSHTRRFLRVSVVLGATALVAAGFSVARIAEQVSTAPPFPTATPGRTPAQRLAERRFPTGETLRFAVLGDPQDDRASLRTALAIARRDGCAFVVLAGDLVFRQDDLAYELLLWDLEQGGYDDAFFPVRGNHDDAAAYARAFGDWPAYVDLGPAILLGVDSNDPDPEDPRLERAIRLVEASPPDKPLFLVLHHPPVLLFGEDGHERPRTRAVLEPLLDALRRRGRAFVFSGHHHGFGERFEPGLVQIVTGATGGDLPPDQVRHFVEIEVDASGGVTMRTVRVPWTLSHLLDPFDKLGHDLYRVLRAPL